MQWKVHGERPIYVNPWVSLSARHRAAGRPPLGASRGAAALPRPAVVVDTERCALMLWRHRFITRTWGWELPMGLIEPGETPAEAAAREVEEETGWRPSSLRPLVYGHPANGITDSEHFLFRADGAEYVGPPTELNESDRIEWIPLSEIRGMIDRREIVSSASLLGIMYTLLDMSPTEFRGVHRPSGR